MPNAAEADRRNRDLAAIHQGKKALGLDDETYRDFLEGLTSKRSAADLSARQRLVVLKRMDELGFKRRRRPRPLKAVVKGEIDRLKAGGAGAQEATILALWDELERSGAFTKRGGFARLDTFMQRIGVPVSHPRFCTPAQATKVIEALKAWLARERRKKGLD